MSSVTIGPLVMSRQAALVLIAGLVASVAMIYRGRYTEGIAMALGFAVTSYSINCMTVGHCDAYAWFAAVVTILSIIGTPAIKKALRLR